MARDDDGPGAELGDGRDARRATPTSSSSARTSATSAACSACTDGLQAKYGKTRVLRRADRRGRHRRLGDRHGGVRPAAGRRDPVRRLHLPGLRPDRLGGGAPALPLGRRLHRADHDPHAVRRRHLRRPDAQPEPGGAVHPRLRAQDGDPVQPVRRQGPADRVDRGRRPGDLPRAEAPLQRPVRRPPRPAGRAVGRAPAGRGARGPLHACRSARRRCSAPGERRSPCWPTARWCTSREAAASETGIDAEIIDLRTLCAARHRRRSSPRCRRPGAASSCTRRRAPAASAPSCRRWCRSTASITSRRRSSA